MASLEADLAAARSLSVERIADTIETLGFECTRCGACCRGEADDPHTATIFPDEVRELAASGNYDWRDVARPMPFGLDDDGTGETFEWALQTDDCGNCTFFEDGESGNVSRCTVYDDRPLICETYPFSIELSGSSPMGEVVATEGPVLAHECEGLGRDIDRDRAEALATTLKTRAVRDLEEAIAVRDEYEHTAQTGPVVHDSEGAKHADGRPVDR